jgi:hypothetical protein
VALAERWAGRFEDLLDETPDLETELRRLVDEVASQPVRAVGHPVDRLIEFLKIPRLEGRGVPRRLTGRVPAYRVTACHW